MTNEKQTQVERERSSKRENDGLAATMKKGVRRYE